VVIYNKNNLTVKSHFIKIETSLVVWLNIVTVVAPSVRTHAHCARMPTPLCIVNDGLVNAMPNMQKTLLQFTTLVYVKLSAIYKDYLTRN